MSIMSYSVSVCVNVISGVQSRTPAKRRREGHHTTGEGTNATVPSPLLSYVHHFISDGVVHCMSTIVCTSVVIYMAFGHHHGWKTFYTLPLNVNQRNPVNTTQLHTLTNTS